MAQENIFEMFTSHRCITSIAEFTQGKQILSMSLLVLLLLWVGTTFVTIIPGIYVRVDHKKNISFIKFIFEMNIYLCWLCIWFIAVWDNSKHQNIIIIWFTGYRYFHHLLSNLSTTNVTAQKMRKSLMENFIFCCSICCLHHSVATYILGYLIYSVVYTNSCMRSSSTKMFCGYFIVFGQ